jgi:diaminohydroxyphosphoribosylaminopyrimidine deaminase/5-amino-6-(5-phosphoribosylamino)uracil reductase
VSSESYLKIALELAKKGLGNTSPNPLVGSVIVKNGRIIGAGFHEKYGKPHAEVNAIKSSKERLKGSTMYVNLEPCSHYGKTPPCADAIINHNIKKVVISSLDPNPLVKGNGVKKLREAGVEVEVGVLEEEARELNKFYFKHVKEKMPYLTLKAAQTLDGKIADIEGYSKWISSVESRRYVHELRSIYDAIIVGKNTVLRDNPSLNVRLVEGRNPKRILIDEKLEIPDTANAFKGSTKYPTFIITSEKNKNQAQKLENFQKQGIEIIFTGEDEKGYLNLESALKEISKFHISSILVEGGGKVFSYLVNKNLFDEISIFLSPKVLGNGISTFNGFERGSLKDALKLELVNTKLIGKDALLEFRKK